MEKLRNTYGNFEMVGKLRFNKNNMEKLINSGSKNGYTYINLNTSINCGTTNPYVTMHGGYFKGKDGAISSLRFYDSGKQINIPWSERKKQMMIDSVPSYQLIRVGLEQDETGKTEYKSFLSPYDAIQYIKDTAENDMVVKVRGKINYDTYNGNNNYKFQIQSIYLVDKEEKDFYAKYDEEIILKSDFLDKSKFKTDREVTVSAYTVGYNRQAKRSIPFLYEYTMRESDFENVQKLQKILKLLKPSTNQKVIKVHVIGNILQGAVSRKLEKSDFDKSLMEYMTEEEIQEALNEQVFDNDSKINIRTITGLYIKVDIKTKLRSLVRDEDIYTLEDLDYEPEVEIEKFEETSVDTELDDDSIIEDAVLNASNELDDLEDDLPF